ncbi:MAG: flagellar hook-basal body complex protein FliE [Bryobacteraceae bacterium]
MIPAALATAAAQPVQPVAMLERPASIDPLAGAGATPGVNAGQPPGADSPFASIFAEAVERVESYRSEADRVVGRYLRGEDQEVHQVALAVQESEVAMELFLQAKNKVVQAYQEIMRMQL